VRIVSLLPSATEIVFALGLEHDLVGVTHECNWPPAALEKRRVSVSLLPPDASPSEIDALVSAASSGTGPPTERLDDLVLGTLAPDVILTQDLCAVCAVPAGDVEAALDVIGCRATVVSLDPSSLEDMFDDIVRVGEVTGRNDEATVVVGDLRRRVAALRNRLADAPRRRTLLLEWGDPLFNGGHWLPGMVELAGGAPVLAEPGRDSVRVTWEQVHEARPEVVVFSPCGYDLEGAVAEGSSLAARAEIAGAEVWAVDADSYFVRPGPRLVDGAEILASILHPDVMGEPPPGTAARLS
jgi:iron complex transport system substrate-binding protein